MRNMKRIMVTMFATAMIMTVGTPIQSMAAESEVQVKTGREQISEENSILNTGESISVDNEISIPSTGILDPEEQIIITEEESSKLRKGTSSKYGWSYGTSAYTFSQKWSTNKEIYGTYPYYDDGAFYPAATTTLNNPKGSADYASAIREGYVNDSWATGTELGMHVYYHTVSSDLKLNSVTVLLDDNVTFQVFDMDLNAVLNTSSPAYSDLLLFYNTAVTQNGSSKDVYTLKLAPGSYYIMFAPKSGTGNFHYAMFTGNPLPIAQSHLFSGTHNGSVKWDGRSTSQTYQCPNVTVSTGGNDELFALTKVTFKDMGVAVNNAYVSSVNMMYQSPNSYSYKTVATMAGLKQDMVDSFPDAGSIAGTYSTKVQVNWMKNLSYVNASYFTNTMMNLDFLVPLGEVKASF